METSPKDNYSPTRSLGYESHTRADSHAQESLPVINNNGGALVAYRAPPAVERALRQRGYSSLQLEARAAELERKARMGHRTPAPVPTPTAPPPTPGKREPTAEELDLLDARVSAQRSEARAAAHARTRKAKEAAEAAAAKIDVERFLEIHRNMAATVSISAIQHACAIEFGVTVIDILSDRRSTKVVTPRHVAMFLSKQFTTRSLPAIGRRFGGRDHTTVLNALQKIELRIEADPAFKLVVDGLRARLHHLILAPPSRPDPDAGVTPMGENSRSTANLPPFEVASGPVGPPSAGGTPIPCSSLVPDGRLLGVAPSVGPTENPTRPVYQTAGAPRKWRRQKWRLRADQGGWE